MIKNIVEIMPRYIGKIIGTRGSNLKQLEADHNVQIQVSRDQKDVSQHGITNAFET